MSGLLRGLLDLITLAPQPQFPYGRLSVGDPRIFEHDQAVRIDPSAASSGGRLDGALVGRPMLAQFAMLDRDRDHDAGACAADERMRDHARVQLFFGHARMVRPGTPCWQVRRATRNVGAA